MNTERGKGIINHFMQLILPSMQMQCLIALFVIRKKRSNGISSMQISPQPWIIDAQNRRVKRSVCTDRSTRARLLQRMTWGIECKNRFKNGFKRHTNISASDILWDCLFIKYFLKTFVHLCLNNFLCIFHYYLIFINLWREKKHFIVNLYWYLPSCI